MNEIKRVFVITRGSYAYYHIETVFESEEQANAYVRVCCPDAVVEDWDIENDTSLLNIPMGMRLWRVNINYDGTVFNASYESNLYHLDKGWFNGNVLITHMLALDSDKAIKIADERRRYLLKHDLFKPTGIVEFN